MLEKVDGDCWFTCWFTWWFPWWFTWWFTTGTSKAVWSSTRPKSRGGAFSAASWWTLGPQLVETLRRGWRWAPHETRRGLLASRPKFGKSKVSFWLIWLKNGRFLIYLVSSSTTRAHLVSQKGYLCWELEGADWRCVVGCSSSGCLNGRSREKHTSWQIYWCSQPSGP